MLWWSLKSYMKHKNRYLLHNSTTSYVWLGRVGQTIYTKKVNGPAPIYKRWGWGELWGTQEGGHNRNEGGMHKLITTKLNLIQTLMCCYLHWQSPCVPATRSTCHQQFPLLNLELKNLFRSCRLPPGSAPRSRGWNCCSFQLWPAVTTALATSTLGGST